MTGAIKSIIWKRKYMEKLMQITSCDRKLARQDADAWIESYPDCFDECPEWCAEESASAWSN